MNGRIGRVSEPATTAAIAVTSAGLTVFGMAIGLHPQYLVAGSVGGLWWLSYSDTPQPLVKRFTTNILSSLIAGFLTPIAVELVKAQEVVFATQFARDALPYPVAVGLGFLAYSRIAPALMSSPGVFLRWRKPAAIEQEK